VIFFGICLSNDGIDRLAIARSDVTWIFTGQLTEANVPIIFVVDIDPLFGALGSAGAHATSGPG
jgi:hypothetical protein